MFTNTIGDPGRGERIADAVLEDPEARAEITAPISDAVVELAGIPPSQQTTVEAVVDQILRDPAGAQAFIDPFAASWARLLGEDDPRSTDFDLTRILGELDAAIAPLGVDLSAAGLAGDEMIVPSVPLPRAQLDWMGSARRGIRSSILPLALAAAGFAAAAFATGDRRRVLRRVGFWATGAGLLWIVVPPLINWATRSWAPGADSVVEISVAEATSGLRVPALVLVLGGLATIAGSFALLPARREEPVAPAAPATAPATPPETAVPPQSAAPRQSAVPPHTVAPHAATISAHHPDPLDEVDVTPTQTIRAVDPAPGDGDGDDDGGDDDDPSVWDFYSR